MEDNEIILLPVRSTQESDAVNQRSPSFTSITIKSLLLSLLFVSPFAKMCTVDPSKTKMGRLLFQLHESLDSKLNQEGPKKNNVSLGFSLTSHLDETRETSFLP